MQLSALKKFCRAQRDVRVEIVSHSCLGGFLARLQLPEGGSLLVQGMDGKPRFWRSLDQVKRDLARQGVVRPGWHLCVAQDEVIR